MSACAIMAPMTRHPNAICGAEAQGHAGGRRAEEPEMMGALMGSVSTAVGNSWGRGRGVQNMLWRPLPRARRGGGGVIWRTQPPKGHITRTPDIVYKGLGGFGVLRHPPTQDQARRGLRSSPGAEPAQPCKKSEAKKSSTNQDLKPGTPMHLPIVLPLCY